MVPRPDSPTASPREGASGHLPRRRDVVGPASARRLSAGMTLIEVLLVLVIIGIAAGVVVPRFAGSFKTARLRSAARTIVAASKYARATAVLQQRDTAVLYDVKGRLVEIVEINMNSGAREREAFLERRDEQTAAELLDGETEQAPAQVAIDSRLKRRLPDEVFIDAVETEREDTHEGAVYWIYYYPSGMCDAHLVRIKDAEHNLMEISIDPISGRSVVEEL